MRNVDAIDYLIEGDIVTMNPRREIIGGGAVAVADDRIADVGSAVRLRREHPEASVIGGRGALVTPGFINAHQHLTADRLVRSAIPDDLPPGASIFEWIVPIHEAVDADDDELSALLSLAEGVRNGITTTIEAGTVAHPERVARAMQTIGIRGAVSAWGSDTPGLPQAAAPPEVVARLRDVVDEVSAFGGRVRGWVALVGHDLMSDELFVGASALARERETRLTFHLSPTAADAESYLARTGVRPMTHLRALGGLGDHVLIAHAVHLDDAEVDAVLETHTAIASCPWAYLRLGQSFTRVSRHVDIWQRGGRLALGCDAENAGDAVDPLRVAALFAGLAKDMNGDPTIFGAHDAFELLTISGAEAIGMADTIGSIEVGKQADLVVFDRSGPEWQTRSADPILQLVWASDGRAVNDVIIDGQVVVRDRRVITVDVVAAAVEAEDRAEALWRRAGLTPKPRWPVVRPSDH